MNYRNVHLPTVEEAPAPSAPRLRVVTNDPAREYAQRPGQAERLPDSVAALILCKSGFAKVERQEIKITLDGTDHKFASSNSITIAEKNGTGERVLWVINRHAPDVLHILSKDGAYIESIPRKGSATWFSSDEASREALAETRRMRKRDMERLDQVHAPDTRAALEREQHNRTEIARLVSTFPSPASDREQQPAADRPKATETLAPARETPSSRATRESLVPSVPPVDRSLGVGPSVASPRFTRAAQVARAIESTDRQRTRHTTRVERIRTTAGSLDDLDPAPAAVAPSEDEQLADLDLI